MADQRVQRKLHQVCRGSLIPSLSLSLFRQKAAISLFSRLFISVACSNPFATLLPVRNLSLNYSQLSTFDMKISILKRKRDGENLIIKSKFLFISAKFPTINFNYYIAIYRIYERLETYILMYLLHLFISSNFNCLFHFRHDFPSSQSILKKQYWKTVRYGLLSSWDNRS